MEPLALFRTLMQLCLEKLQRERMGGKEGWWSIVESVGLLQFVAMAMVSTWPQSSDFLGAWSQAHCMILWQSHFDTWNFHDCMKQVGYILVSDCDLHRPVTETFTINTTSRQLNEWSLKFHFWVKFATCRGRWQARGGIRSLPAHPSYEFTKADTKIFNNHINENEARNRVLEMQRSEVIKLKWTELKLSLEFLPNSTCFHAFSMCDMTLFWSGMKIGQWEHVLLRV